MTNKKKKKATPVVNRGFATSSIASKPRHDPNEDINKKATGAKTGDAATSEKAPTEQSDQISEVPKEQLSPEELEAELERNDLQLYIESHGPKVVKDTQRQISKMVTDCRVLRAQSQPLNVSPWISEELLETILDFSRQRLALKSGSATQKRQPEEVWVDRFWTLSKILQDMSVSKERIFKLLEDLPMQENQTDNSGVWGLRRSLDVLALDTGDLELRPYEKPAYDPRDSLSIMEQDSEAEKPRQQLLKKPILSLPNSGAQTPSRSGGVTPYTSGGEEDFAVSDLESDLEPEEMEAIYVDTKLKLFKLQPSLLDAVAKKPKGASSRSSSVPRSAGIRKLQDRLRRIESDMLFNSDAANQRWMTEKINYLRTKPSSGVASPSPFKQGGHSEDVSQQHTDTESITEKDEPEEGAAGDLLGGMFIEPTPSGTTPENHSPDEFASDNVILRDFGKVTGYSPRRLLEDACRARDSTVKITYRQISDTTFACRHSVTVSWSKSQEKIEDSLPGLVSLSQKSSAKDKRRIIAVTIAMRSVATPDAAQSEAYIATAAAFLLFNQSSKEEKMYLKIGSAWRELWTGFIDVKNAKRDADDRETVKSIRKLVEERIKEEEENGYVLSDSLRNMNMASGDKQTADSTQFSKDKQDAFAAAHYIWQTRIFSTQYQYMLQFRNGLPMARFREHALHTINTNQITILCGETGCGKSTQLPAFIMEDQFMQGIPCKVLCTEPRRISAISLAHRVSQELGEQPNEVGTSTSLVGYAVRLESHIGPHSRLIYATVGVVLRMLEDLNGLNDYTHLIIDEVHERSIETDFLLIVLQNLCKRRPELKVVLMSATVDASRFSAYLDDAPIIDVPGRTFPVNTKFLEDAIEITKTSGKSHNRLQEDDEDVEQEVSGISNELQGYSIETRNTLAEYDEYQINYQLIVQLMETIITQPEYVAFKKAILVFLPGIAEIRELHSLILNHHAFGSDVLIYPLHSTVSSEEQQAAFVEPPAGMLKIVLATNIAETGVTIPDVTCVIDTGTHKEMRFDERRQLSRLVQSFISRANAKQRRGRAGRVQEGICFHLFTKKRHDELMANQQTPEMLRLSLQDLVMRVKMCGLGNIEETLSQALDPPSSKNIRRAIDALIEVGALTSTEELTTLGRQLVKMPLDAQLGKLVLLSAIFGCLDAGLTIAAILSSKSPFITPFGERQRADAARQAFSRGDSDLLTSYNAYCGWRRVLDKTVNENIFVWCRKNFLSHQILSNIEDLKSQLYSSLGETGVMKTTSGDATRSKPANGSYGFKAALRVPSDTDVNSSNDIITSTVIAWSFYPKLLIRDSTSKGWRSISNSQTLSLHPTSVNRGNSKPKYLSFYSIMQSGNKFYNSTNAISTNIAHEVPLLLFAGEAEFKMHAGVLAIDSNRLRYVLKDWRTAIGMKMIRTKLEELVERAIEGKRLTEELEWWMGVFVKICTKAEKEVQKIQ